MTKCIGERASVLSKISMACHYNTYIHSIGLVTIDTIDIGPSVKKYVSIQRKLR